MRFAASLIALLGLLAGGLVPARAAAPAAGGTNTPMRQYQSFAVAVYIPVRVVQSLGDRPTLERQWDTISRQVKVDKVYIETERDRVVADEKTIESVKAFFRERGVRIAGGITFSDNTYGQFRSFCYTNPEDRAFVRSISELTARHFDEIILDDFFFVTTKYASDIAAKGERSWTQFRLDLMNEAGEELVVKPARKVNPRVKIIIKYPNWYEHFQGLGFDLERGPQIFDGIYTGTETRDPVATDQFLQQYESYQIFRYFENVAPGRNGGGWVDTFAVAYLDRYAEQLWDTLFAKPPEFTLFNWAALLEPIRPGERSAWEAQPTSFSYERMLAYRPAGASGEAPAPTMARVAGYSLDQVDAFLGKLGKPIGVASYKPHHSTGEDFLHNYIGMIGIPIDLYPTFPESADLVLLTEAARTDPAIVARIKAQLVAGKSVVITSGLLRALQGKGIEDIVEVEPTERRIIADGYSTGFGSGPRAVTPGSPPILFPQIRFLTNDAWALVSAMADKVGFPLLLMDRYANGILYVWTMPDNPHHLYDLPPEVTTAVKDVLMKGFFVRLDGPSQVALFAYDNRTFVVESFLPAAVDVKVSVTGDAKKLRNLVTGEIVEGHEPPPPQWRWRRPDEEKRVVFDLHLLPHSYAPFVAE
jgi:hypothetical protein